MLKRKKTMEGFEIKMCPRCQHQMKSWNELTTEERILVERLPMWATHARRERETHYFCPRCWHEEADANVYNC